MTFSQKLQPQIYLATNPMRISSFKTNQMTIKVCLINLKENQIFLIKKPMKIHLLKISKAHSLSNQIKPIFSRIYNPKKIFLVYQIISQINLQKIRRLIFFNPNPIMILKNKFFQIRVNLQIKDFLWQETLKIRMLIQMSRLSNHHHCLEQPIKVVICLDQIKVIKVHLYLDLQINLHHHHYLLKKIKPLNLTYSQAHKQNLQIQYSAYQKHLFRIYLVLKNNLKIKKHQHKIINRKKLMWIINNNINRIFSKKTTKFLVTTNLNSIRKNKVKSITNKLSTL